MSSWLFAQWLRIPLWSLNTGHAIRKCGPGVYKSVGLINSSVSQYFLFVWRALDVNQTPWWIISSWPVPEMLPAPGRTQLNHTLCHETTAYNLWTVPLKMYTAVFSNATTPAGTMTSQWHLWCSYLPLCRNIIASESFSPDSSFIPWPPPPPSSSISLLVAV